MDKHKNINFQINSTKMEKYIEKNGNFKISHQVSDIWHGTGSNSDQVIWTDWYSYEGIHIDDVHIHDNHSTGNMFYSVTG